MQIMATYTALPVGVYILSAGMYINSSPFATNIQFGLDGVNQNTNLQHLLSVANNNSAVVRLTTIWAQTTAVNVYFSAAGFFNFQNIAASYVRIG